MGTVANAELLRKVMKNCVEKKGWARAYFQAWLTASEMLQDRGYEIEDDDGSTDLLSYGKYGEFLKRYYREEEGEGVMDLEELNIIASHRSDPTNKVVVNFLARHRNVNLGAVHAICDAFEAEDIRLSRVILVGHNCSLIVERFLVPRDNYTVRVEIFDIAALFENVVRYGFLLKYEMITEEEKRQLLSVEFKLAANGRILQGTSSPDVMLAPDGKVFPVVPMSPSTMVAQYFALKKGDFVKGRSQEDDSCCYYYYIV